MVTGYEKEPLSETEKLGPCRFTQGASSGESCNTCVEGLSLASGCKLCFPALSKS